MNENKDKINDLLKKFSSFIENIHDNYASIQNLERQKKIADKNLLDVLENQIQEINIISTNNQKKAVNILDEIIQLTDSADISIKKGCKKLKEDFTAYQTNPDLLIIQEDINQIKNAI